MAGWLRSVHTLSQSVQGACCCMATTFKLSACTARQQAFCSVRFGHFDARRQCGTDRASALLSTLVGVPLSQWLWLRACVRTTKLCQHPRVVPTAMCWATFKAHASVSKERLQWRGCSGITCSCGRTLIVSHLRSGTNTWQRSDMCWDEPMCVAACKGRCVANGA